MTHSRSNQETHEWTSKQLGSGIMTYYVNSNNHSAIEATITFKEINVALENFPKLAEVGFPCKSRGRNFTIKMDLRNIKALRARLAIGIPVVIEQRITFA